ncbi:hypothetical protein LZ30DRAFT_385339 [Colletotrichum cereale]|nr:hypothetical protein LZ30DRAFT_385339 [Colletotrichum cereale]
MPIWFDQPPKKKKAPADDEIAPYPSTARRARRGLQEEDFEKEDIFKPSPSRDYLNNLMNSLKPRSRHKYRRGDRTDKAPGWKTETNTSTRTLSTISNPTSEQFGRLRSEFRRQNGDKRVKKRRVMSMGAVSKDPARGAGPESRPADKVKGKTRHLSSNSQSEERVALERIPKRKLRFKVDEPPAKKRR